MDFYYVGFGTIGFYWSRIRFVGPVLVVRWDKYQGTAWLVREVNITVFPLQLLPTSYTFFCAIMYSLNSFLAIVAIASALRSVPAAVFDKIERLPRGWNYARNADPCQFR